ncbi:MAG: SOS response-associated peptidase, partial [Ilumatobacteraceae bacterium]
TCCVLTTDANAAIDPIHDRMPVILEEEDWSTWLDPTLSDRAELTAFMVPAPDEVIDVRPVSTRVNSVRNNEPSLLDRID